MSGIKTDTSGREIYNLDTSAASGGGGSSSVQIDQTTPGTTNGVQVNGGNAASGASDAGNPVKVGGRYNATPPTLGDGQRGDAQLGSRGSLSVQLKVADSGSAISSTATPGDGASNSTTNLNASTFPMAFNGTGWDRQRGDTNGLYVGGNVAAGASDAGNPVKVGARYNATLPTLADGQRGDIQIGTRGSLNVQLKVADGTGAISSTATPADGASNSITTLNASTFPAVFNGTTWDRLRGDVNGALVQQFALSGSRWSYAAAAGGITNTTTAVTIAAAAGAGLRNYLTGMQIFADTLGTATEIVLRDGANGTVLWRGKINTGGSFVGAEIKFTCPLKGTANTLMEVATLTASGTGSVYINAQGYSAA